jgi:hypothetical protein
MGEGRFYGLFVASTALVAALVIKRSEVPDAAPGYELKFFLANSLLVTSHILGVCYSAALLLALITIDKTRNSSHRSLYLATIASWLWLIPSAPAILSSAAVGKPHFWTAPVDLRSFVFAYTGASLRTAVIACAIVLLAFVYARKIDRGVLRDGLRARMPVLIIIGALFLLPLLFAIESIFRPSLFNTRYMQPVMIATFLAMCEIAMQIVVMNIPWLNHRVLQALAGILLVGMVLQYDLAYLPRYASTHIDYARPLVSHLPRAVPILCEDAFTFTELIAQQPDPSVQLMYLLDWQYSISPSAPRLEVTQYHLMENWKRVGYFASHVMYRSDFLSAHPFFLVLHTDEDDPATLSRKGRVGFRSAFIGDPLAARFTRNPGYLTLSFGKQAIGELRESEVLVCRRDLNCVAILHQLKQSMGGR